MTVMWTKHRFSGGALVFDTTNTVVHRGDPVRSFDRFADRSEIARFAAAAAAFRADELGGRVLEVADAAQAAPRVLAVREAADRLFRSAARDGGIDAAHLPALLRACAAALDGQQGRLGGPGSPLGDQSKPIAFEAALAVSALSLLSGGAFDRVKICPNCNWLFLDGSRNGSRVWCDMAVCGNRHKARRHYLRSRGGAEGSDA